MSNLQLVPQPEAANGRDLSNHSTRGDFVSNRRGRNAPKPLWLTVLRVFVINFVRLVLLVGLIEMVNRHALRCCEEISPFAVSDLEGRISRVEKLVEITAKTKSDVEALDRKIDSEVGGLRKEVGTKIEEKSVFFESQLKELKAQNEILKKLIEEFKGENRMLKEEFEKKHLEFRKAMVLDVIAYPRHAVLKEMERLRLMGFSGLITLLLALLLQVW